MIGLAPASRLSATEVVSAVVPPISCTQVVEPAAVRRATATSVKPAPGTVVTIGPPPLTGKLVAPS